ncbi:MULTISPECIES: helix-turn-helix domain-containing protein [Burkholderia]|uniref:helix-turn-helix domain-containing protein n=1 Tax=Burkholderia TaxID=32008 RepID=UPI000B7A3085|nr:MULTISPECIES: helix-turn-helix transcriptional regulator [Burkholderia]MBY4728230.1 helix-turn-helix domain-containing protein [Burkholderia contaminans]MCI3972408.1 helix-turn-helix domain-containing protein [Burkholderia sp. HI4860]MDN7786974.1 helix-turn-helix transcriptional regulator [Burkholderia contaminans]OXJ01864.1 XRE family transcriptional regulator [Burkholderia sp. AU33647]
METIKSDKGSVENRKVERPLPVIAQRTLKKLGGDINRARRRRGLTQQALAERVGAGLSTIKRLEAGDPRMQLHVLARVLQVFGELDRLSDLLDSAQDDVGLALMDEQLPQRIRTPKKSPHAF